MTDISGPSHVGSGRSAEDLEALTGVRSGKRTYYSAYLRSAERVENTVKALDRISRALVRTAEGPRGLVEAVLHAAADHLQADWMLIAVADGTLEAARPRFLMLGPTGIVERERDLPPEVIPHLDLLRGSPWEAEEPRTGNGVVRVAMTLDGEPVGGLAGLPGRDVEPSETDLAIIRVLANQVAVALHNSFLLHAATRLRGRTEELSETAARHARDLVARDARLAQTEQMLTESMQRQALDDERHRIARELHDSVTQDVLSAGMTIELCRAELAEKSDSQQIVERLATAKDLTRRAVEKLRGTIYALYHSADDDARSLPDLLRRLSEVHLPGDLLVRVTVIGEHKMLPGKAEHSLLRISGEALFNTVAHSCARQAHVRLLYYPDRIVLTISDDGNGDPEQLRRLLDITGSTDLTGAHRGLANMHARIDELNGVMSIRRSQLGGIMLRFEVPLPVRLGGRNIK